MVINIPINFDETLFEGQISKDIENKIVDRLSDQVTRRIEERGRYTNYDKFGHGMDILVEETIGKKLDEFKPLIVEKAGEILAERLVRSKAAKEKMQEILEKSGK